MSDSLFTADGSGSCSASLWDLIKTALAWEKVAAKSSVVEAPGKRSRVASVLQHRSGLDYLVRGVGECRVFWCSVKTWGGERSRYPMTIVDSRILGPCGKEARDQWQS
jgi:hypothetical protein